MSPGGDALHRALAAEVIRKPVRLSGPEFVFLRLMRTMVALTISGEKFPVETLSHIEGDAGPIKLVVTVDSKGSWRRAA